MGFAAFLVGFGFGNAIDHERDTGHDNLSQFVIILKGFDKSSGTDGHFIGDRLARRVDGIDGSHGDDTMDQGAGVVAQFGREIPRSDLVNREDAGQAEHVSVDVGIKLALLQSVEEKLQTGSAAQHLAGGIVVVDFSQRGADIGGLQDDEARLEHGAEFGRTPLLFLAGEDAATALAVLVDEAENGNQLFFNERQEGHFAVGHGRQKHPEQDTVRRRESARAAGALEDLAHMLVEIGGVGAEAFFEHCAPVLDHSP